MSLEVFSRLEVRFSFVLLLESEFLERLTAVSSSM